MSLQQLLKTAKLKPLTLLILLSGVVAIAYVVLGASAVRRQWDHDALSSQIELAEGVLVAAGGSQQDLEDLEARLGAAEQELALAQAAFPSELDSNSVLQTVLAHASESQVRVLEVNTQPPATEAREATAYSVLAFNLKVEGGFSQLVEFLAALESGALSASRAGDFSLREEGGQYVLDLEVLTYARSAVDEPAAAEAPGTPSASPMETAGDGGDAAQE